MLLVQKVLVSLSVDFSATTSHNTVAGKLAHVKTLLKNEMDDEPTFSTQMFVRILFNHSQM